MDYVPVRWTDGTVGKVPKPNLSRNEESEPGVRQMRWAVLPLGNSRFVIYDRWTSRIVDGVYFDQEIAVDLATYYNATGRGREDKTPNSSALRLIFPSEEQIEEKKKEDSPEDFKPWWE